MVRCESRLTPYRADPKYVNLTVADDRDLTREWYLDGGDVVRVVRSTEHASDNQ
jgi:hypothetical protein